MRINLVLLFLKYLHNRLKEFTVYLYADGPYWHKGERVREALNEKVGSILEEALSKSPEEYKLSRFRWDSVVIVEFIKKKLNISLQPRQARNWLKKLGYVRKRPIHSYVQASDKGIKEFRQGLKKKS